MGDVASGVVSVVQVLKTASLTQRRLLRRCDRQRGWQRVVAVFGEGCATTRVEPHQPERLQIIGVPGGGAVLVLNSQTLTSGVVVDAGDAHGRWLFSSRVEQPRGLSRALQPYI